MKLSVLIPMHNASKYIERCLNSIYHQGLKENDFEIVIIDDGSTDDSVELVVQFQSSHTNIRLYCEENNGAYTTRNKLLHLAKGTYIYCLDADDYLATNSLCKLLDIAMSERLDLMCFDTEVTEVDDLYLNDITIPENFKPDIFSGQDFIRDNPYHRVEIWWYLIRRDFLEQQGIKFGNNQYNADVVFTLKLLLSTNRMGYAPFPVHRYYQSSDSLMRSSDPYKKKRLLIAIYSMVKDLDNYVNSVNSMPNDLSEDIKDILNKRRDQFSFYFLVKLLRSGYSVENLKQKVESLKKRNIYPLETYLGQKYSLKYQFLNLIINNEDLLFPMAQLIRMARSIKSKYRNSKL
ncbi:MAG: glycosyltransferase [Flavobacteriaceae bacterium]